LWKSRKWLSRYEKKRREKGEVGGRRERWEGEEREEKNVEEEMESSAFLFLLSSLYSS
jgi:hypothetical protein